jgi:hypothetical protein
MDGPWRLFQRPGLSRRPDASKTRHSGNDHSDHIPRGPLWVTIVNSPTVPPTEAKNLHRSSFSTGITLLRPSLPVSRFAVTEAESRRVYKQKLCYDCGTPIVTGTIDGRATYACPRCQPESAG